jgi:adenylate kinase family enzyme
MLVYDIVTERVQYPLAGKAVFMAGLPGAGKTLVSTGLFQQSGFQKVDIDDFFKLFQRRGDPVGYDDIEKISGPTRKRLDLLSAKFQNIIIDSTGRKSESILRNKQKLEDLGYQTAMVLVQRDPEQAVHATMRRELATGRSIDPEFIHQTSLALAQNAQIYKREFGPTRFFVINTDQGFPWSIDFAKPIWPQLPAQTAQRLDRFLRSPVTAQR